MLPNMPIDDSGLSDLLAAKSIIEPLPFKAFSREGISGVRSLSAFSGEDMFSGPDEKSISGWLRSIAKAGPRNCCVGFVSGVVGGSLMCEAKLLKGRLDSFLGEAKESKEPEIIIISAH